MKFSDSQLSQLAETAIAAARAAGQIINNNRNAELDIFHKDRGSSAASQVVTEIDHRAQAAILEILHPTCAEFDLALLTEESPDTGERLVKPAFWSIDPMDGTLAFIKKMPGFSVSIALVENSGSPLIGVVYDPVTDTLFKAIKKSGIFKNNYSLQIPPMDPNRPLILQTDYSFAKHPWFEQTHTGLQEISAQLGFNSAEITFAAGCVMTACQILQDPNSCYFKYARKEESGGSLWDYAATACLFHEAKAVATDIYGTPMELNRKESTFMNHRGLLFAAYQELADEIVLLNKQLQSLFQ